MQQNLKKHTVTAILWNALDKGGSQFIYLVTGIFLARILSPTDFGLVGMLSIFVALSNVLFDSGFSSALVRKVNCTEYDYNTVFYFNIIVSCVIYVILFFLAPIIASFFNQPQLTEISRVLFLVFIFNSLGLIQNAILLININNRALTISNLSSLIVSSLIALIIAIMGYAVWALVAQALFLSIVKTIFLWNLSKWRPKLIFNYSALKELLPFSVGLTLSKILSTLFLNIYSFIIGKFYQPKIVGYYAQAVKWSDMGGSIIYITIQSAAFQVFSNIKDDQERLVRAFRKTIRLASFLVFPALVGAVIIAKPFIIVLLTDKWLNSVILFQWLCIAGIFTSFASINFIFLQIKGRTDIILKLETMKIISALIVLALTIKSGIVNITIGQVIIRFIFFLYSLAIIGKEVKYPLITQLTDMVPYFGISVLMAALIYPIHFISNSYIIILICQVIVAIVFYFAVNRVFNSKVLDEIITFFKYRRI